MSRTDFCSKYFSYFLPEDWGAVVRLFVIHCSLSIITTFLIYSYLSLVEIPYHILFLDFDSYL